MFLLFFFLFLVFFLLDDGFDFLLLLAFFLELLHLFFPLQLFLLLLLDPLQLLPDQPIDLRSQGELVFHVLEGLLDLALVQVGPLRQDHRLLLHLLLLAHRVLHLLIVQNLLKLLIVPVLGDDVVEVLLVDHDEGLLGDALDGPLLLLQVYLVLLQVEACGQRDLAVRKPLQANRREQIRPINDEEFGGLDGFVADEEADLELHVDDVLEVEGSHQVIVKVFLFLLRDVVREERLVNHHLPIQIFLLGESDLGLASLLPDLEALLLHPVQLQRHRRLQDLARLRKQ
mmetsp:Transcript_9497/g.9051  ORF Transcript_9497/g.9051 Transcript_9497/m.9051 type:complete len:286 (+) Transcript_9497:1209-2066(+)